MSSNTESRAALIARANQVLNTKPFTPECSALFDRIMKLSEVMPESRAIVTDEERAAKHEGAFKSYLRGGDAEELRTYTALTSSGVTPSEKFLSAYVEKLKSFSGIRAVANVITTATGQALKNPYTDDTANTGERLNENDPVSLANPVFNKTTFGAYSYSI